MYRKGLAFVLVTALMLSLAVPGLAAVNAFSDVPEDHWAYDSVQELASVGLIEGFPDGTFKGQETFTRYEMAQVFARMLKLLQGRLSNEIDEKLGADRADLEKQIAAAAKEAQDALAKAIAAQDAADQAQGAADAADSKANSAQTTADAALAAAKQALEAAETANAAARQAQANADAANAAAQKAQATADAAMAAAKQSQATADAAAAAARQAQATANEALAAALKAQKDADAANAALAALKSSGAPAGDVLNAQQAADDAMRIANEAKQAAADANKAAAVAQDKANAASTDAAKAQATADSATAAAQKAQATADTANANAAQAQSTANDANAAAQKAQATADTAIANAAKAQSTADAALAALRQAQATADAAAAAARQAQATADANQAAARQAQATANEALAAALKAQKDADAANAALAGLEGSDASALDILNAQKAADAASRLAAEAKQAAAEANKAAADAQAAAANADAVAQKALAAANAADANAAQAQATATKAVADAAAAQAKAGDAQQLAEAAYSLANAAKIQADELAAKAGVEPVQVTEVVYGDSSVANEAKSIAEEALQTAKQAKQLAEENGDADAAMAKAEEAYKLAVAADARAKAAQATADAAAKETPKEFVLDDAARRAIDEYVAEIVVKDLNDIRDNADDLAKRVRELEANSITATDAEFIAAQIVSKQLYDVLGRITSLEMAQKATEGDIAAIRSMLNDKTAALANDIENLSTEYKKELNAMGVEVADLRFGMGKLEERIIALEAQNDTLHRLLGAQELQAQRMGAQIQSNYDTLDSKIGGNTDAIAALQREISALKGDNTKIASDVADTQREVYATKSELAETKATVANLQADLARTNSALASVQSDLSDTKQDVAQLQTDLAPIKSKFDSTRVGLSVDLVTRRVGLSGGNSLYTDPREAITSQEKKATAGDWYNNRIAALQENYILYGFDVFTVPAPGSTLSARIYAKQWDVPVVNKWEPGIEMDLTTQGVLRSFHVGELTSAAATAGFNKFILDPEKWESQFFRMNGFQALLQSNAGITGNVLLGHGNIKPIDLANNGNDLPGMDTTDLLAASVDVPLGPVLNLRGSWINVPVYSGTNAVNAGAVQAFGNWKAFDYSATIASSSTINTTPTSEFKLAQNFGDAGWQVEYLYTGWKQRLAQADVDGLTVGAKQTYAAEFHGVDVLGFELMAASRFLWTASKQNAWLARVEREFDTTLPIVMAAEVGGHSDRYHTMLDLGVNGIEPMEAPFAFDFGYRWETMPILSEGWTQRWTNIESNASRVDQNWLIGSYINEARAKATLSFSDLSYAYAGAKFRQQDFVNDIITNAGLIIGGKAFGGDAKVSYELEANSFNPAKATIGLTYAKPLGAGSLSANVKASFGQGTDSADRKDGVGTLRLALPVYENTMFNLDGNYYGSYEPGAYWYNHTYWRAGLSMTF